MKYFILITIFILGFLKTLYSQGDTLIIIPERQLLTEENLIKIDPLNQEIVSASRSSKKVEDLPMTIYIVTREDIIKNNYITLVDILKTLPGMRVSQPGSGENGETFLMRGLLGNTYTKILINNIPIKPSVTRGMAISAQIPIRQAERIEIIYGPASSIYGADATSGVINIITKEASSASYSEADASIGTNGYSYFNFMAGGRAGKNKNTFDYNVFGNRYNWRSMDIYSEKDNVYRPLSYYDLDTPPPGIPIGNNFYMPSQITEELMLQHPESAGVYDLLSPSYRGTLNKPDFAEIPEESSLMGFNFSYKNLKLSYLYMDRQSHSSIGKTSQYFRYDDPTAFWGEITHRVTLGHENSYGNLHSTTNLSYESYRIKNQSTNAVTYLLDNDNMYFYSASDDLFAEQIFVWSKQKRFEVTFGGSFQYSGNLPVTNDMAKPFKPESYKPFKSVELDNYYTYYDTIFDDFGINPITYTNSAVFGQFYYEWRKFTFIAGARFDYNSLYSHSLNPRTAVLYKLNAKNSIRGAWGHAFNAPSSSLMYQSLAYSGSNIGNPEEKIIYEFIPNTELKPETFQSEEIGYRRKFRNSNLDVSFYSYTIQNLISSSIDTVYKVRRNVNNKNALSNLYGMQTSMRFFNIIKPIKLNADISLDLTDGSEVLSDTTQKITHFRQLPEYMWVMSFSAVPFRNAYVKLTYCSMGDWYRQYGRTAKDFEHPYSLIDGYQTMDMVFGYTFGKNLTGFINIKNIFDEEYGGIDVTGSDVDLHHNPQPGRNFRFGITYTKN